MKSKSRDSYLWAVGLIVLCVASIISIWKLVDVGVEAKTAIPAICFPIASAFWAIGLARLRRQAKGGK